MNRPRSRNPTAAYTPSAIGVDWRLAVVQPRSTASRSRRERGRIGPAEQGLGQAERPQMSEVIRPRRRHDVGLGTRRHDVLEPHPHRTDPRVDRERATAQLGLGGEHGRRDALQAAKRSTRRATRVCAHEARSVAFPRAWRSESVASGGGTASGARTDEAEGEGFEPSVRLRAQRFSRPPRSTTPAPLRGRCGAAEEASTRVVRRPPPPGRRCARPPAPHRGPRRR
jgi:hypothetical protein